MSPDTERGYHFGDGIQINPIAPGTTVLVAGPTLSGTDDLARSMVADGEGNGEGSLFISTNKTCEKLWKACQKTHPSLDPVRTGIIDCSGQEIGKSELDVQVKYVSTQSDLTGIGMKFSSLYESLYADVTDGRVRTSLISLSSLSMYVDLRKLFQFLQTLSSRIDSANGLGVFSIDPTAHDTQTVNTLSQVADGRIEVREAENDDHDAESELRVRGLADQPNGWHPFSLS